MSSFNGPSSMTAVQPRFTLVDDDDEEQRLTIPANRRVSVFNLELDGDDEDDVLIDYQQYAGLQRERYRFCGVNWSWLARICPWMDRMPPSWWYRFSKRQQRIFLSVVGCLSTFLILLIGLTAAGAAKDRLPEWMVSRRGKQFCSWSEWRLPEEFQPEEYRLSLHIKMQEPWLVQGTVTIDINVALNTHCIVLHSADTMVIKEVRLGGADGQVGEAKPFSSSLEQVILEFDNTVKAGLRSVFIAFEYPLREGLSGFYRSKYTLDDGKEYSLATTQFEANSARKAFPCFDEPALKAVFHIGIVTNSEMTVLSNMPIEAIHHHEGAEEGTQSFHFEPTPKMSTYLVAFIIGDLKSVERLVPSNATGVPERKVAIWGTPDRIENLDYAADVAATILPAYEAAFGIPFALPKLDLVAIPDFAAGAMENWGLITYRETALLSSPTSGVLDLRYITLVIAHEMAHQWFGNLVTCKYWGELWLNEGFASYIEYLGANAAHPEMSFFEYFWVDDGPKALYFDSKAASHPLSTLQGVNSTDVIEGIFDPVSYETGASLLRMLRSWINRKNPELPTPLWETTPQPVPSLDPFLQGLQQYLQQYKYGSATADGLWKELSTSLGQDIEPLMNTWTYNRGYPVINVTVDAQRRVWLTQAPFSLQGAKQCDVSKPWWIPVAYVTSAASQQLQWGELRSCQGQRALLTLPEGAWLKLNAGQYGYYRVNYASELWKELVAAALTNRTEESARPMLPSMDLAGLVEDSYALAEAGMVNITIFLDLLSSLRLRTPSEYAPWAVALPYIQSISRIVPCADTWRKYLRDTLFPQFLQQTASPSTGSDAAIAFSFLSDSGSSGSSTSSAGTAAGSQTIGYRMLRPAILQAAGYFGDTKLVQEVNKVMALAIKAASKQGSGAVNIPNPTVDADVLSAVYQSFAQSSAVVSKSDGGIEAVTAYHTLLRMYVGAKTADEKERALRAIGYSPTAVTAALELSLTDQVRSQDVRTLITTVAARSGVDSPRKTWDWFVANWDAVYQKLGGDGEALRRMNQVMESIASLSADPGMLQEIDALSEAHKDKLSDPSYVARAKESITANAAWVERHGSTVCNWLPGQN